MELSGRRRVCDNEPMTERGQIDAAAGDSARPNALLVTLVSRVSTGDRNALESTIP